MANVVVLPWTALPAKGGKPAVWIVDPAQVRSACATVAIAVYEKEHVVLEDGLKPGELRRRPRGQIFARGPDRAHPEFGGAAMRFFVLPQRWPPWPARRLRQGQEGSRPPAAAPGHDRRGRADARRSTPPFPAWSSRRPRARSSFRVLGRIISRPVKTGDRVEAGQMVAAVDPTAYEAAARAASATPRQRPRPIRERRLHRSAGRAPCSRRRPPRRPPSTAPSRPAPPRRPPWSRRRPRWPRRRSNCPTPC